MEDTTEGFRQTFLSQPFLSILVTSLVASFLLVGWEDLTYRPSTRPGQEGQHPSWGQVTVQGLGFGRQQRLASSDPTVISYNEVMHQHRIQVQEWKHVPTEWELQLAIRTLLQCWLEVNRLKTLSNDYQWEDMRSALRQEPLASLGTAASRLRQVDATDTIGFDWGSCAWRHCGAWADATEAMDELDHLVGVLEPFECNFILDVLERSIRDMLVSVDWRLATQEDADIYSALPPYIPHRIFDPPRMDGSEAEEDVGTQIDDDYLRALQDLSIDIEENDDENDDDDK